MPASVGTLFVTLPTVSRELIDSTDFVAAGKPAAGASAAGLSPPLSGAPLGEDASAGGPGSGLASGLASAPAPLVAVASAIFGGRVRPGLRAGAAMARPAGRS